MNKEKITKFFNALFPNLNNQFIEIRYKKPGDKSMKQLWFQSISSIVSSFEEEWDEIRENEMFFGVCPRTETKGKKEAIKQVNCLWIDIDWKEVDKEDARELYKSFEPKPHIVVNSGHGIHLYWLIEPFEIKSEEDVNKIEGILKGIREKLKGDNVVDISRILRIPETYNNKDKPIKVEILRFENSNRYNISDFEKHLVEITQIQPQSVEIPKQTQEVDLNKFNLPRWLKELIVEGWSPDSKYKSRSECDIAVMEGLIRAKLDDDIIYSIFTTPRYKISDKTIQQGTKYFTYTLSKAKQYYDEYRTEWQKKVEKFADFNQVIDIHKKWLHIEDDDYLRVLHATLISHKFDDKPVWILLVAPPSGTKTVVLQPLIVLKDFYNIQPISELTAKTFVSGDKHYKGLLDEFKNGILLFKDFTTVLQLDANTRSEILQQLREIWDGHYLKVYGTGKKVEWSGKITFLAGTTEYYEAFREIDQTLGERYLLYKPFIEERKKMVQRALFQIGKEKQMNKEIQEAIYTYHNQLDVPTNIESIPASDEILSKIASLTDFVTRARSSVKRDFRKDVEYIPIPEAPTRLAKQLMCLAKALTIINKNTEITEEEFRIISKVGLMTIATDRLKTIKYLQKKNSYEWTETAEISHLLKTPKKTTLRLFENLYAFGIVENNGYSEGESYQWRLTDEVRQMLEESGLVTVPMNNGDYTKTG